MKNPNNSPNRRNFGNPTIVFKGVVKFCKEKFGDYLKKISIEFPEIDKWIEYLSKIPDKDRLKFFNEEKNYWFHQMQKDLKESEKDINETSQILLKEAKSQKLEDFFNYINPLNYRNLSEQLKKDLAEDSILDKFNVIRKRREEITSAWMSTIITAGAGVVFNDPIVINDENVILSWPILVDSYVRDFEILFKFIIRPILELEGSDIDTYGKDLNRFFEGEGKIFAEITGDAVKPYVRSRFAHQLYYINIVSRKIIYFEVDYDNRSKQKEISIEKLNRIVKNINLLVWCIISLIMDISGDTEKFLKDFFFPENDVLLNSLKSHPYFEKMRELSIITKNADKLIKNFQDLKVNTPDFLKNNYFILESFIVLKIFIQKQEPPTDFGFISIEKAQYLIGYSLFMERFIKPFYMAKNSIANLKNIKDWRLLDEIFEYKDKKYEILFEMLNSKDRIAIAHLLYFFDKEKRILMRYDRKSQDEVPIALDGPTLFVKFDKIEGIFNPKFNKEYVFSSTVEIIYLLFIDPNRSRDKIDFWDQQIEILSDFGFLSEMTALCHLKKSFLLVKTDNIKKNKKKIRSEIINAKTVLQKNREYIMLAWSWIVLNYFSYKLPNNNEWLKLVMKFFTILPGDPKEQTIVKAFKELISLNPDKTLFQ